MHRQAVLFPEVVFRYRQTDEKVIALTFDDGPDPITPQLLDILAGEDVPATFYVLGSNVSQFPEIARRIALMGMRFPIIHGPILISENSQMKRSLRMNWYQHRRSPLRLRASTRRQCAHLTELCATRPFPF